MSIRRTAVLAAVLSVVAGCQADPPSAPRAPSTVHAASATPRAASGPNTIRVDGDPSDWAGIAPLISDPTDQATSGIASVRVTNDVSNVYFLLEMLVQPSYAVWVELDVDRSATTGCSEMAWSWVPFGSDAGLMLRNAVREPAASLFQNTRTGSTTCSGIGVGSWETAAWSGPYIEVAVPTAALRQVGVAQTFDITVRGYMFATQKATYTIVGGGPPLVPATRPCDSAVYSLLHGPACAVLQRLRDPNYLGISPGNANDAQLLALIASAGDNLNTMLAQIDYGRDVDAYLHQRATTLPHEKPFYDDLGTSRLIGDFLLGVSNAVLQYHDYPVASAVLGQSESLFGNILEVLQDYRAGLVTLTNDKTRQFLYEYTGDRYGNGTYGMSAAGAWQDVDGPYGEMIGQVVGARQNIPPSEVGNWMESAYQAYRLVGYPDSPQIRAAIGRAIATVANGG